MGQPASRQIILKELRQLSLNMTAEAGADLCSGLHRSIATSEQTKDCVRQALVAGSPVYLVPARSLGGHELQTAPRAARTQGPATNGPIATPRKIENGNSHPQSTTLAATGRVVGVDNQPVTGAKVLIREWASNRTIGMPQRYVERLLRGQEVPDILAEATTDAKGEFRFADVIAPAFTYAGADSVGKTVFPWDVIAFAPGHGIAWARLTPRNQRAAITLTLPAEGTLRGHIVEPGGKPIAGARVKVVAIDPLGHVEWSGGENERRLNLSWSSVPLGATTGTDGSFILRGLPRAIVASLVITAAHHDAR